MKYRHEFHAGNFADVHKHVALLSLLGALQRKDKGFLYLDTHAGRGDYRLASGGRGAEEPAAARIVERFAREAKPPVSELASYARAVLEFRERAGNARAYPGSPLLALAALRAQDRAVFLELEPGAAHALQHAVREHSHRARVECADGFERLRAFLPPPERRGLTLIDPPYEETSRDFRRVIDAIVEALQRFRTGVIAAWYPIKERQDIDAWHATVSRSLARTAGIGLLASELWLYPPDSRVSLNGSGLLIVNPPFQSAERMQVWLPALHDALRETLRSGNGGGTRITTLAA